LSLGIRVRALESERRDPSVIRGLRWYEKKRGSRRTGSPWLARAAEALFFALLIAAGLAATSLLLSRWLIPEWQANRRFTRGVGRVLETRLLPRTQDGATVYRPEVRVQYQVDGQTYETWTYDVARVYATSHAAAEAAAARFRVGQEYPLWYDPRDPLRAALVLGTSWWGWLLLLVPLPLVVLGLAGLIYVTGAGGSPPSGPRPPPSRLRPWKSCKRPSRSALP
jgi:hypothetical protein